MGMAPMTVSPFASWLIPATTGVSPSSRWPSRGPGWWLSRRPSLVRRPPETPDQRIAASHRALDGRRRARHDGGPGAALAAVLGAVAHPTRHVLRHSRPDLPHRPGYAAVCGLAGNGRSHDLQRRRAGGASLRRVPVRPGNADASAPILQCWPSPTCNPGAGRRNSYFFVRQLGEFYAVAAAFGSIYGWHWHAALSFERSIACASTS